MRALRLLRVAVLSVLALIVWAGPKATHAQYGGFCCTFDLLPVICPSCCSVSGSVDEIEDCPRDGYDTIGSMTLNCGSSANCKGVGCGSEDVLVPVPNGACYCAPERASCVSASCCDDQECSDDGTCKPPVD